MDKPKGSPADRRRHRGRALDLAALLVASSLLLGWGLGVRDLWNPNEPTYGRVVVEMVEGSDWLVPHLNGEPFVEKPILYYWLAATASIALGEVSPVSLRLPVMAVSVLGVLLVYLLIVPYDGRRRALIASALFATLYGVWFNARNGQMDSFVLIATLGAIVPLSRLLDHGLDGRRAWLLAGLAAGLGFAAKGPVAVAVPALVVAVFVVVGRRPWRRLLPGVGYGAAAFLAMAAPWYLALYLGGHVDALRELLVRQNFERFVDAWDHRQPWYYYLRYLWLTFAPWSWFLPVVAAAALRRQDDGVGRGRVLAWVWLLVPLVFFSLSESKREPYLLPIAPAVAWLVAWLFEGLVDGRLRRWQTRAVIAVSVALGMLLLSGALVLLWPGLIEVQGLEGEIARLAAVLIASVVIILGIALWRPSRRHAPAAVWIAFALVYSFVAIRGHGAMNPLKSHRLIARDLEHQLPEGHSLYSYFGPFRVVRGGYPFYLGRAVPDLPDESALRQVWAEEPRPCVLYEDAYYRALMESLPAARERYRGRVGGNTVYLVCAERGDAGPGRLAQRRRLPAGATARGGG